MLDRYEILHLRKLHPEWSYRTLAESVGCRAETARLVVLAAGRECVELMSASASDMLDHWAKASGIAATRGDHRPSRDWLLHAGSIEPMPETSRGTGGPAVVIINAPLPGMPGYGASPAAMVLDSGQVTVSGIAAEEAAPTQTVPHTKT